LLEALQFLENRGKPLGLLQTAPAEPFFIVVSLFAPIFFYLSQIFERQYSVVIADDDMDDQYLITRAIEETGVAHSIHIVHNGLELINYLFRTDRPDEVSHQPDLVVMDLNMPLIDGFGALARIRGSAALRDVPVYILSTSRFEYDKVKSLELGATDFFIKPYNFAGLKTIIREIFTHTVKAADSRWSGEQSS